jgi:hypothetical protein
MRVRRVRRRLLGGLCRWSPIARRESRAPVVAGITASSMRSIFPVDVWRSECEVSRRVRLDAGRLSRLYATMSEAFSAAFSVGRAFSCHADGRTRPTVFALNARVTRWIARTIAPLQARNFGHRCRHGIHSHGLIRNRTRRAHDCRKSARGLKLFGHLNAVSLLEKRRLRAWHGWVTSGAAQYTCTGRVWRARRAV